MCVDIDATLITAHSDKQSAAGTFKCGFGFHPLLAYRDRGAIPVDRVLVRTDSAGATHDFLDHLAQAGVHWRQLVLIAQDLFAWLSVLALDGDLAVLPPTTIRYRLLHVAGRITTSSRQTVLRLDAAWPWANTQSGSTAA